MKKKREMEARQSFIGAGGMQTTPSTSEQRKASPEATMDEFKARLDQARKDGERPIQSVEDIQAAFREHAILEPVAAKHEPVMAEVISLDASMFSKWFVATFVPRMANKVERRCDEAGWAFNCPKTKEWRPVKHAKKGEPSKVEVEHPLFGTYAFLKPHDPNQPNWQALDRVDGLGGLVRRRLTRVPVTVPKSEVEKFNKLEEEGFFDATRVRPPKIKKLDRVFITGGPFQGLGGFVSMTTAERVKVLLGMLGQVELPMDLVEVCA